MKRCLALISLAVLVAASASAADLKTIGVTLTNTLAIARPNEPVVISVADLKKAAPDLNLRAFRIESVAGSDGTPGVYPAQADDTNGDGTPDEIALVVDMSPQATIQIAIRYSDSPLVVWSSRYPKRAHAAFHQKYEGMGWESDRVAWRMYFDERNAFDMYGKRKRGLALDYFAKPDVDYHSESPIGRDVFKIGDALGIGAVGAYVAGNAVKVSKVDKREWKVVSDGPVRAIADLIYTGWDVAGRKVDLTSRITVWAGQHWFEHSITAENAEGLTLVTGLPRKPGVELLRRQPRDETIATWGHQALVPGATATEADPKQNLGLGIIRRTGPGSFYLEDTANHLIPVGRSGSGVSRASWRVLSAWDQEDADGDTVAGLDPELALPRAVQSARGWTAYVANQAKLTASPIVVRILSGDDKDAAK